MPEMRSVRPATYPKPPAPPKQSCQHHFELLETRYIYGYGKFGNPSYRRIDRFYCTKCCEEKVIEKHERSCRKPDWFIIKNCEEVED